MEDMGAKKFESCMDACDEEHIYGNNETEYGDIAMQYGDNDNQNGDDDLWKTSEPQFDACVMACGTAAGYSDFYEDDDADSPEGAPTYDEASYDNNETSYD